jgi:hypothetical protein
VAVGFGVRASTQSAREPAAQAPPAQVIHAQVLGEPPDARARVVLRAGHATLHVSDFPAPPPGRVYKVWLRRRGGDPPAPTDALFVPGGDHAATVSLAADVRHATQVLVTAERDPSVRTASRAPVVVAQLR